MDRREFLKLSGWAAAAVGFLDGCSAPRPRALAVPWLETPEQAVPGVANWYATVCMSCEAGCGVLARVIDGRAVKLEGNPDHPINLGKLCARGQLSLQELYHPDRLRGPMRRHGPRGSGQFTPISWEEALSSMASQLKVVGAPARGALEFVARPGASSTALAIERFVRAMGGQGPVWLDLKGYETLQAGVSQVLGLPRLPYYDLAHAQLVLNFGADLFATWLSPVMYGRAFGAMRRGRPGVRGSLIHLEPRMAASAVPADRWVPLRPGSEGLVALAIAHLLFRHGRVEAGHDALRALLEPYAPERVAPVAGVLPETLERLAHDFGTRRPALALVGGAALAHPHGVAIAAAVHLLNRLVGSVGIPGGVQASAPTPVKALSGLGQGSFAEVRSLIDRMRGGRVHALLVHRADPLYEVPRAMGLEAALAKIPFIVSFSSLMDDTACHADLILPDHTPLEGWGVHAAEPNPALGVLSSQQPAVAPVFDTRPVADVLIALSRALSPEVARALPWSSSRQLTRSIWDELGRSISQALDGVEIRRRGVWAGSEVASPPAPPNVRVLDPTPGPTVGRGELFFYPYFSPQFAEGRGAALPGLQELPDPTTSGVWSSWVELHPRTAERLGLKQGQAVAVRSPLGSLEVRVQLNPGLHPEVAAMPMGQGHAGLGRYAAGRGRNPLALIEPLEVSGSGALAWAATRVSLEVAEAAPSFTRVVRTDPQALRAGPGDVAFDELVAQHWPWDGREEDRHAP